MVNKVSRRILNTLTTIDSYDFSKFSRLISKIFSLIIQCYIVRIGIIIFEFPNLNISTKIYIYCLTIHNLYLKLPPKIKILPLISKDRWLFRGSANLPSSLHKLFAYRATTSIGRQPSSRSLPPKKNTPVGIEMTE